MTRNRTLWLLAALSALWLPGCAGPGRPRAAQAPTIAEDKLSEIQKELSLYSD